MRAWLVVIATVLVVLVTANWYLFKAAEPALLIDEPDQFHAAAAPFCTIPGPPRPLERDRRNPLELRSLA